MQGCLWCNMESKLATRIHNAPIVSKCVCVCQETNQCPHANEIALLLNDCVSIQIPFLHACVSTQHTSVRCYFAFQVAQVCMCVFLVACYLMAGFPSP